MFNFFEGMGGMPGGMGGMGGPQEEADTTKFYTTLGLGKNARSLSRHPRAACVCVLQLNGASMAASKKLRIR